jgi:hypothetical protein
MFEEQQFVKQQPSQEPNRPQTPNVFPQEPKGGGVIRKLFAILLILILIAGIGYGGYLVYNKFFGKAAVVEEIKETPTPSVEEETVEEDIFAEPIANLDTDKDGLSDEEEMALGTSKVSADTDNDALSDFDEVKIYKTDPLNSDTDNDGYLDGGEVKAGFNPKGEGKLLNINEVELIFEGEGLQ